MMTTIFSKATTSLQAATAAMMFPTRRMMGASAHFLLLSSLMMMMLDGTTAFLTSPRHTAASAAVSSWSSLQNAYIDESSFPLNNGQKSAPQQQQTSSSLPNKQPLSKSRPPKIHPETGGQITLVGSGPGSVSLLTLAAHTLITNPENLLIVDRLVSDEILNVMEEAGVQYKIANKKPGCQMAAQDEIFEWCKAGLREGRHVVRLKIGECVKRERERLL